MAGHRFCVHVVAAGFVAAAGSLALADLSAVASAEPDGGGSHGSAGSRDSGKGHSSSGGGQHSAGSESGSSQQSESSGVSGGSGAGGVSSGHGGADSGNNGNSGGVKGLGGQDAAGRSVAVKPKNAESDPKARRAGSAASPAAENGGADAKSVTKPRALTDPKPDASGISRTPVAADVPAVATGVGVVQTAGSAVQHPVDGHSLQPSATQKNVPAAVDAQKARSGDDARVKQPGTEMPGRASGGSVSGVGRKAQVKATTSAAESASQDAQTADVGEVDKAGKAVTSTVRIGRAFPSASAITDAKTPEHLVTVQIPSGSRPAVAQVAPVKPSAVVVTAPAPVAPLRPLPAPAPAPAVPANTPSAPGTAMTSIASALTQVSKRSQAGDTVSQEPPSVEQRLHVQKASASAVTEGSGEAVNTVLGQAVQMQVADIANAFETAAVQKAEDAPRIRVRRDTSSADDAGLTDAQKVAQIRETYLTKAAELGAERAKLAADSAALRAKHDALTVERQQLNAAIEEHNKALPGIEATDRRLQQENAALTADILAHNARAVAHTASNTEAAALAIRQASLNTQILIHNQYKLYYNAEKYRLDAQEASVNARADENLAEGIRLRQRGAEFSQRVTQLTEDLGKALGEIKQGNGRAEAIADVINAIKLSQQEAAQAANTVSKAAFGETAGIATLPDGRMVVLPQALWLKDAMAVLPDGTVTVLRGVNLNEFLRFLPDVIG